MTIAPEQLGVADPALRKVKLLTLAQVADVLGVDRTTVYRWRRKKDPLPVTFLPGGLVRVPLAALQRWVAEEDEAARQAGAV